MTIFTSSYPAKQIPNIPLYELVLQNCERLGDKIAIIDGTTGYKLTYTQLKQQIELVAANLQHRFAFALGNDGKQPVFAIHLPNHPLYPVLFHAINMAGGIVTTINPMYTAAEIAKQAQDSGAQMLITVPMILDKVLEALNHSTQISKIFVLSAEAVESRMVDESVQVLDAKTLLAPCDKPVSQVSLVPREHLCALPFSSGTTGLNKGVMLTHYSVVSNVLCAEDPEPFLESDVVLGLLPFYHIYAMVITMCKALFRGTTVVSMPKFDLVPFLEIIQNFKITRAHLVPPVILALAKHPIVEKFDLSSIQVAVSAAAPLSKEVHHLFVTRFPKIILKQGYGMTELSPVVSVCPDNDIPAGSSGILLANTEARVVDTQTGAELGVNQEGELQVRGPQVMKGYLNNAEATAVTIVDGWLCTGDVCRIDERGHIFIVDRVKELIKYKGYQVAPAELEGLLHKMDGVADVAVVGIPDEEAGELPKAFVVRKPGSQITEEEVISYVEEKVAPYKKIRAVQFIDAVPRATSGKILRRQLKATHVQQGQQ